MNRLALYLKNRVFWLCQLFDPYADIWGFLRLNIFKAFLKKTCAEKEAMA
jgi:hypothetical protein